MMKRLVVGIITAFLALPPALADEHQPLDLAKLSQDTLTQGMNTLGVCAATDLYAIKRYTDFYNANKADSTASGTDAGKALEQATELYGDLQTEITMLHQLATALSAQYKLSENDIKNSLIDLATATDDGLEAKYGKVDSVDQFIAQYKTAEDNCASSIESFVNDAKKQQGTIEQPQTDHQI